MSKTKVILSIIFLLGVFSLSLTAQWVSNPSINKAITQASGNQLKPEIISSSLYPGISYVSWLSYENGNYNMRLQKLDAAGNELWGNCGLLISDHTATTWLKDWDMIIDANDCAIIVFQDVRTGSNSIFAYKISPDGSLLWGDNGIQLSNTTSNNNAPKIAVTNAGNIIVVWEVDSVIIRQKISSGGILKWGDDGLTLSGTNTYSCPQLLSVGKDDIIMKYIESIGKDKDITQNIYAQRFDQYGNEVWSHTCEVTDAGGVLESTRVLPLINDGNDGFYIAWNDDRNNNMLSSVFVHHINSAGQILFPSNGVSASNNTKRNHYNPHLVLPQESNNVFVYWNEMNAAQNNNGIYGQKISPVGVTSWNAHGKAFIEISSNNVNAIATKTSDKDMLVVYEESSDNLNTSIKAMRIHTDGSYIWPSEKITMSSVQSKKRHTAVGGYNFGQWIAVWEDDRNKSKDIYAQNIQLDGKLGSIHTLFNASFTVDENSISVDETVQFNENSLGNITSWKWKFEGGNPATSLDQNQSVTYNTSGYYDVELIISDGVITDTTFCSNYIFVYDDPDRAINPNSSSTTQKEVSGVKTTLTNRSNDNFFIVVGCFSEELNARQLTSKLRDHGIDALVIDTNKYGMFRVAIKAGNNHSGATRKLTAIRKHDYPDAWLLVK